MQYENGCWLTKEGVQAFWPKQALQIEIDEHKVRFLAPEAYITGHGATLGGIVLTITVTTPAPEVIRVQTVRHIGGIKKGPSFGLNLDENAPIDAEETEEAIVVRSGSLALTITKDPFSMTYSRDGQVITKSNQRDLAFIKEGWTGFMYDKPGHSWMSERLSLGVDEQIYGLGERFGTFVKNGQSVVIRNEDGGTCTEQSYKNIPFYLSSKGYGVFVNHPETVEFEVGTEQVSKVGFAVAGESLDYFIFNGPDLRDVLRRYTDLTGKPALPAQWTFGLWLSTSFTTSYDSETVMSFVNGMLDRGIPLSVFHFDCCWLRDFHWTDFVWDSKVFEDPAGLIAKIHEKGIKVCCWINSYVGQEGDIFKEGAENGYFIKRKDGSVFQWDMWQPGLAIVDFTNPDAVKWYQKQLKKMMAMGVDCFKTDFGERIPDEDVTYFDGSDPKKMHNYYTYLYNQAVFEAIKEVKGEEEAVVFARSATAGGQKFPVHWGGDCWSTYDGMYQSIRGGLSFTSSGFGFWAHDIGGFEDKSTADVYKRWVAFGLLSTHSRLHGSSSYRVPWLYDEEAVDVCRCFTKLKLSLLPYLYSSAVKTHETGIPMMRAMVLDYQNDLACRYLDRQYMLGEKLLVAPVFNEEGIASWYLPKDRGLWTAYLTGEEKYGNSWFSEKMDYFSIPLYVKPNSVIPTAIEAPDVNISFEKNVEFKVYQLQDQAETVVYQNGKELYFLKLTKTGSSVKIETNAEGCRIRFVNESALDIDGYSAIAEGTDLLVEL